MKQIKPLIVTVLFLIPNWSFSQQHKGVKAVVPVSRISILYVGIDNPIEVAIPGYKCEEIFVTVSQGKLTGGSCNYSIKPETKGSIEVSVFAIKQGDTIALDTRLLRSELLPTPIAFISKSPHWGPMQPENISDIGYMLLGFEYDVHGLIDSFHLQIIHNADTTEFVSTTASTTLEMKTALKNAQSADEIIFTKIFATLPDNTTRRLADLILSN